MVTQERAVFILRGTVQRQKLEEDVERIVGLYQDHGYVQMRVERYDTSVNRETARVTVTIDIVEGAQYRVGTIKLTGLNLFPEARSAASFASRRETSSPAPSCATPSAGSPTSTARSAAPRPR